MSYKESKLSTDRTCLLYQNNKHLLTTFNRYNMVVICIQERHIQRFDPLNIKSNNGKNSLLYYSGHQLKSIKLE